MRAEIEEKNKEIIKQNILDEFKEVYYTKTSKHYRNGTLILMKKLLNEDFIFKDITELLHKSHKIKLYNDRLNRKYKK